MPHELAPHEDRRLDVERHRVVLERAAVPLAHQVADQAGSRAGSASTESSDRSPAVDTRAANATSESAAVALHQLDGHVAAELDLGRGRHRIHHAAEATPAGGTSQRATPGAPDYPRNRGSGTVAASGR